METARRPDGNLTFQTMVPGIVPPGTALLEIANLLMDQIIAAGVSLTGHLVESLDAGPPLVARDVRQNPVRKVMLDLVQNLMVLDWSPRRLQSRPPCR